MTGIRFIALPSMLAAALLVLTPAYAQNAQPLTLSHAVSKAMELNRELRAARFDEAASSSAVSEARSPFWPQLSWESNASKSASQRFQSDFDPSQLPDEFQNLFGADTFGFTGANYINQFRWQQLVFDYAAIGQLKLAKLQQEAARWQTIGQEQSAVYQTVSVYLQALRAGELLAVQKQRLQLADEQLDTAQTAFDVGLRIRTDVLRAQLTRSSARRDVVSAEIAVERAVSSLKRIIGAPLDSKFTVVGGPLPDYSPPAEAETSLLDLAPLYQVADQNNPSISIASLLVDQGQESIGIARGEFYPRLSGQATWGFNEQGDPLFEDEEWSVAGVVTVPIFEGGRRFAKLRGARESLSAEEQRFESTYREVHNQIELTALSLQEEMRNLEIAVEAEAVAEENYDRFQNLYAEGLADSLDVTQALTELVEARTNVVTTRYDYLSLYAQLLQALGVIPVDSGAYINAQWLEPIETEAAP